MTQHSAENANGALWALWASLSLSLAPSLPLSLSVKPKLDSNVLTSRERVAASFFLPKGKPTSCCIVSGFSQCRVADPSPIWKENPGSELFKIRIWRSIRILIGNTWLLIWIIQLTDALPFFLLILIIITTSDLLLDPDPYEYCYNPEKI